MNNTDKILIFVAVAGLIYILFTTSSSKSTKTSDAIASLPTPVVKPATA
jgi:hypothetical protein